MEIITRHKEVQVDQVILLLSEDGDIIQAVRPDDPLNPGFTVEKLESMGFGTELLSVNSLQDVIDYEEDHR